MAKQFLVKQCCLTHRLFPNRYNPPGHSELGVIVMKGYSTFPKAPASPSNSLVPYQDTLWGGFYPTAEIQSVYSTGLDH